MKVIFLDIDGVLITGFSSSGDEANKNCIAALNLITDTTGAKIVVSSTWRWMGMDKVLPFLSRWGVRGDVIGATPTMCSRANSIFVYDAQSRATEIQAWLTANKCERFAIIDDETNMEHLQANHFCTEFERGLTEGTAKQIIEHLAINERNPS